MKRQIFLHIHLFIKHRTVFSDRMKALPRSQYFRFPSARSNGSCDFFPSVSLARPGVWYCLGSFFFLVLVKVREKDYCIVFTGKQQKCRDRASLRS